MLVDEIRLKSFLQPQSPSPSSALPADSTPRHILAAAIIASSNLTLSVNDVFEKMRELLTMNQFLSSSTTATIDTTLTTAIPPPPPFSGFLLQNQPHASSSTSSAIPSLSHLNVDVAVGAISNAADEYFERNHGKLLGQLTHYLTLKVFSDNQKTKIIKPFIHFLEKNKGNFNFLMKTKDEDLTPEARKNKHAIINLGKALFQYSNKDTPVYQNIQAFSALVTNSHGVVDFESNGSPVLFLWSKRGSNNSLEMFNASEIQDLIGVGVSIITIPSNFQAAGTLAWSSFAYEVSSRLFLEENKELKDALRQCVIGDQAYPFMKNYLTERIEELVCDVLSVLSGGPTYALSFIGFTRGMNQDVLKSSGPEKLNEERTLTLTAGKRIFPVRLDESFPQLPESGLLGKTQTKNETKMVEVAFKKSVQEGDIHLIDILRAFAMMGAISGLSIDNRTKETWMKAIEALLTKDLRGVGETRLNTTEDPSKPTYQSIPVSAAAQMLSNIAQAIVKITSDTRFKTWQEIDEKMVGQVTTQIHSGSLSIISGFTPRHVLAATVIESCQTQSNTSAMFLTMRNLLIVDQSHSSASSSSIDFSQQPQAASSSTTSETTPLLSPGTLPPPTPPR